MFVSNPDLNSGFGHIKTSYSQFKLFAGVLAVFRFLEMMPY